MFQTVSLVAWMLAMPFAVETAVPESPALLNSAQAPQPELDFSKKHCERVEGTVFCKGPGNYPSERSLCFFSYCDAVAAGYTQCRAIQKDETCGKPQI
jgi:hypothetical protein